MPQSDLRPEIILIGPMAVGKTRVAMRLAEILRIPHYELDLIKWYYILKNGYNTVEASRLLLSEGFPRKQAYFDKFFGMGELKAILHEFRGGILDLGASHSHFSTPAALRIAEALFAPFPNIFLLLPTSDIGSNCAVLDTRIVERYKAQGLPSEIVTSYLEQNRVFLRCSSNHILAKSTLYTDKKSVAEVADEIVSRIIRT